jgi:nucleoside-diphosphate-sugar epimerase
VAILITGGLGVIGTRLTDTLRAHGHDVKVTDLAIFKDPNYIRADVCEYFELDRVFRQWPIEHVFHLAGEVGRENGELFPKRCVDVNVSGLLNLIQLCREHGARLYFASSSEVYGERGSDALLTEDLIDRVPVQPHNCYGLSKLQAEQYIQHFVDYYDLEALSFRFFMCYGPPEYPNPFRSAMTNFVYQALRLEPIRAHEGTARSWCFIDDIVEGCRLAMERFDPARGYQAYNIGRVGLVDMVECAKLVCRLAGAPEDLVEVTQPGQFVTHVKNASFDKAYDHFGFEAKIDLEEGIRRTIEWQREYVVPDTPAAVV